MTDCSGDRLEEVKLQNIYCGEIFGRKKLMCARKIAKIRTRKNFVPQGKMMYHFDKPQ